MINVVYAPVALQALLLGSKPHESRTGVASSMPALTLRQLAMFVVDKAIKEDRHLLLASKLVSITHPDGTTQSLGPAARDSLSIFGDLCLLGNGERPQFLQLHKTFALGLIEKHIHGLS